MKGDNVSMPYFGLLPFLHRFNKSVTEEDKEYFNALLRASSFSTMIKRNGYR